MLKLPKTPNSLNEKPLTRADLVLIAARAVDIQKIDNCASADALLRAAIEEHDASTKL